MWFPHTSPMTFALSEALTADDTLEALPVLLNTRIDTGSDQLNGTGYPEDYEPPPAAEG